MLQFFNRLRATEFAERKENNKDGTESKNNNNNNNNNNNMDSTESRKTINDSNVIGIF